MEPKTRMIRARNNLARCKFIPGQSYAGSAVTVHCRTLHSFPVLLFHLSIHSFCCSWLVMIKRKVRVGSSCACKRHVDSIQVHEAATVVHESRPLKLSSVPSTSSIPIHRMRYEYVCVAPMCVFVCECARETKCK